MSYKDLILFLVIISVLFSGCFTATVVKESTTPTPNPTSSSTPSTFSIKGAVHDYKGAPMPNAKVTLWQDGLVVNMLNNPQYSDNLGTFEFSNVPSGEYKVIAEKDGQSGFITYAGYGSTDIFILGSNQNQGGAPAPTQILVPNPTLTPAPSTEYYQRTYTWSYKGTQWTDSLSIPKSLYDFYKGQPHNRRSNYVGYALSDYDRTAMKTMITDFKDAGTRSGYSEYDNVMNVVCFVQSLPYTSDKVTTGYDEYPRYPIETLVDNGGDCEDTSILTAALLNEMGYGVVLVKLPGHMAVGVKCSNDYPGTYYEYNGARYYYLETTGDDWDIGKMPSEYMNSQATILPMVEIPQMDVNFTTSLTSYDNSYAYYRVHCNVKNLGPGTASNVSVYMAAFALSQGSNKVWLPDNTVSLGDYLEGSTGWAESTLRIPRDEHTQIECVVFGDNFNSVTVKSNPFDT